MPPCRLPRTPVAHPTPTTSRVAVVCVHFLFAAYCGRAIQHPCYADSDTVHFAGCRRVLLETDGERVKGTCNKQHAESCFYPANFKCTCEPRRTPPYGAMQRICICDADEFEKVSFYFALVS